MQVRTVRIVAALGSAFFIASLLWAAPLYVIALAQSGAGGSKSIFFRAPAGTLPTTRDINIDGYRAAILPNGRLVTPVGTEVMLEAPKPYGLALSPDGMTLATINSGASQFSISLIRNIHGNTPAVTRVDVNATFMGIAFSADGSRFFASGGENGNVWIGETATNRIIGSVNLNGASHPIPAPLTVTANWPGLLQGHVPRQPGGRSKRPIPLCGRPGQFRRVCPGHHAGRDRRERIWAGARAE